MKTISKALLLSLCLLALTFLGACHRMYKDKPGKAPTASSADKASCHEMAPQAKSCSSCAKECSSCDNCKGGGKCPCMKDGKCACDMKDCPHKDCKCRADMSCKDMKGQCGESCQKSQ